MESKLVRKELLVRIFKQKLLAVSYKAGSSGMVSSHQKLNVLK